KVDITIPTAILSNLADGSSQTLTVTTSDLAGNAATPYQVPFTVDKTGPARPSFVSITSTATDPNPADPFTGVVNPTVVISGQAGQTIVIHGPNGIVDPSNYNVVDNKGIYTITFITNQASGSYQVNLKDANGNENADGPGAQNFFNIDSVPVLYDMPNKRSTALGSTFGNLGVKNSLNGQTFNVPQQPDNTWIDLDGETLTFGLSGSTVIATGQNNLPTMIEASVNGASLKLDPRTGAYTYTPVSNTDRLDTFIVTIRDTSGNQTQLKLVFNSRDTLDRDGIGSISESVLAGLINQSGNATNLLGDLNQDGLPDSQQNSVSTLAWRKVADFQTATDSSTAANTDPTAIICIVVNATAFDPALGYHEFLGGIPRKHGA
ncbi:MAG: hypothetical protein EBT92_19500, partial [Planctomycetes bacterium]|nr:hypothetical protein [Planctomycetota bacterium]